MPSLLNESPTSGYVLAQWAVQFAIEHPEHFYSFLSVQSQLADKNSNPVDIITDLEMAKSLINALAVYTDRMLPMIQHLVTDDVEAQGSDIDQPDYEEGIDYGGHDMTETQEADLDT